MVLLSKFGLPPQIARHTCKNLLHPWTDSCVQAVFDMYKNTVIGSSKYFILMALCQYLMNAIKENKQGENKETAKASVLQAFKSTFLFTATGSSLFMVISCTLRRCLGRYYKSTLVLVPGFLSGGTIFSEPLARKQLISNVYANMALESILRIADATGTFQLRPGRQTLLFMLLSASLSSLLYRFASENKKPRIFWFFNPAQKAEDPNSDCCPSDICLAHIAKSSSKYFVMGFLLQYVKFAFSKAGLLLSDPSYSIKALLSWDMYTFGVFLSSYIAVYQVSKCLLLKHYNEKTDYHDLVAGFLAGSTYWLYPNITVFNSALMSTIQMIGWLPEIRQVLPRLPYIELVFALSNATLYHSRVFYTPQLANLMMFSMTSTTNGHADRVIENVVTKYKECGFDV